LTQTSYYSTQEAEKDEKIPEEEPLHTIINDTENVKGKKTNAIWRLYNELYISVQTR
jgi:hypothetical protein